MGLKESRWANADHTGKTSRVTLPSATNILEGLAVTNLDSVASLYTGRKPYGISQGCTVVGANTFLCDMVAQGDRVPVQTDTDATSLDKGDYVAFADGKAVKDATGIYTVIERDEAFDLSNGTQSKIVFIQLR